MKGSDSISTENKRGKVNNGKTALLSLACALSVILCGCTDVTASSGSDSRSSAEQSTVATTAETTVATSATTPQTTTAAVTTTVTSAATAETTTTTTTEATTPEPQTQPPATEPEPQTEPQTEPEQVITEPEPTDTGSDDTRQTSQTEAPAASTDFDTEFFDDALFIGDSITTGLYLYGYLDPSLVYAKLGLAPSTALDSEIDGETIDSKISANKPSKIYIMLGTNSVGYADGNYLAECMGELVTHISKISKAKVYVLSIPPVTYYAEADYDNALTTSAINEYNSALESVVSGTKAKFLDLHSVLTAPDGYYYEEYHEMDGIHFMGSTYQVMLSFLEKHS